MSVQDLQIVIDNVNLECQWLNHAQTQQHPTLVFLHEGLGCVALWRDFPAKLCAATNSAGFVYSRQGYGKSDPIPLPRPINFMHTEGLSTLPKLLDAAEIEAAILVGHSDGASIALINGGGVRDPRVKGIISIAAHVFIEEISIESIDAARAAYQNSDLREKLARYHGDNVDCAFRGWNEVWLNHDFREWNLEEYLPQIDIPVLVLQGSEDQYGTAAQVEAIYQGIGGSAETHMIDGSGHSPHLEAADETLDTAAKFIKRVVGGAVIR